MESGTSVKLDAGIVFALDAERKALEQMLGRCGVPKRIHQGMPAWYVGDTRLYIVESGMGAEKCADAVRAVISRGARWLICAGFAAGLNPAVETGDVILGNVIEAYGTMEFPPLGSSPNIISAAPPPYALDFKIISGSILTSTDIIHKKEEKAALYQSTSATALDMESYAAASVCSESGVFFAAVRSIVDPADIELPEEIILTPDAKQARWNIVTRPSLWPKAYDLYKRSRLAAANLGEALGMMIMRLSSIDRPPLQDYPRYPSY